MKIGYQKSSMQRAAILFLLWIVVTACNLFKPIHMDDPVYLYGARATAQNPLRPYDAIISWNHSNYGPLSTIAQPPATFYGLAAVLKLFGESELALHAYESLFSLLAIVCFFNVLKILRVKYPLVATALFCVSPAFIPSQNLMTDIPLVSGALLFFNIMLSSAAKRIRTKALAALVAVVCCFIKYLGAVLLPVYILILCTAKISKRSYLTLSIPLILITFWCLYTYVQYGHVHILQSNLTSAGVRFWLNCTDWLVCLGAITPFSFLFLRRYLKKALVFLLLPALAFAIAKFHPASLVGSDSDPSLKYLLVGFWLNGLFVACSTIKIFLAEFWHGRAAGEQNYIFNLYLLSWFVGGFLFIGLFAEYLAVRHVLFVYPVVVAAVALDMKRPSILLSSIALVFTAVLGIMLAVSDMQYANMYKKMVTTLAVKYRIRKHPHQHLLVLGPWGWQWYAEKNGMKAYAWNSRPINGDILFKSKITPNEGISPRHDKNLFEIGTVSVPANTLTILRTMSADPWGGFYASNGRSPPWRLSHEPLDEFTIYKYQRKPVGVLKLPMQLDLAKDPPPLVALIGFNEKEAWGRWTAKSPAQLNFNQKFTGRLLVTFSARSFDPKLYPTLDIRIGTETKQVTVSSDFMDYSLQFDGENAHKIFFETKEPPKSLFALTGSGDIRTLGVAIKTVRIETKK